MPHASRKLTLYHAVPSRSGIVRWMLEEIGHPYEVVLLDLSKSENLAPAYLRINPMGKVPALGHGDAIVTEVAAICCYLADTFPEAGLAPAVGDPLRGPYLKWLFFGPSCIEPAVIAKVLGWSGGKRGMLGWADFDTTIDVVAAALARGPYVLGDRFTAADVVIGSQIRWGLLFKTLPARPEFVAYAERLQQRPALLSQIALDDPLAPPPAA